MLLHKKVSINRVYSKMNRDTSALDCKHKHMLQNGAPPNKFVVRFTVCYIIIEFHYFNSRINVSRLSQFGF